MTLRLNKIVGFLDKELNIASFEDDSHNGLQVENSGMVTKIACGVDASLEFFQEAKKRGANLVICHHGISWGDSLKRITEINYKRISFLIKNDIALYACHLPLDAHPVYGNNALICKALKLKNIKPFGVYKGKAVGFRGKLSKPMPYKNFKKLVADINGIKMKELRTMDFGKKTIKSVAVVSGAAADKLEDVGHMGIDVYVSGEPTLTAYHAAQEYKTNAIFAGHYATEVFGVKAVAKLLKQKFKIKAEFIDMKIPY
ncbi:Nif3-like dinuclear metal center hexameric protein [Verrucomicrobiota bacterium]